MEMCVAGTRITQEGVDSMETKNQDRISELVEKQKDTYTSMADEIWGYAEPRFQEYESSRVQQEYLASRGFSIRADLAGEKTAFIAEWGSGKPILAFLGEFDALSFSRRRTARSVIQSREKQMDMAAATIFSERPLWRLSMR